MKQIIPGRLEWAVFAAMAAVCGVLVTFSTHRDTMLFCLGVPVFFVAALMGLRRNPAMQPQEIADESDESETID